MSIWTSTPSILTFLVKSGLLTRSALATLRIIAWGGEVLPVKHLIALMDLYPRKTFINLYGVTETTVDNIVYTVDPQYVRSTMTIPIGQLCPSSEAKIINEDGQEVDVNTAGELYLSGECLTEGYLNGADIRSDGFYRTGDIVWKDENGIYHFAGRKDMQVQINGNRVELGEIEAAFYRLSYVDECCVFYEKNDDEAFFTAFVVSETEVKAQDLQKSLLSFLPRYMIPSEIVRLDRLPRLANGKIDRAQLKQNVKRDKADHAYNISVHS
jgi:acyl-coenzyme A synthetase/AMP-(fatty) acid ligase